MICKANQQTTFSLLIKTNQAHVNGFLTRWLETDRVDQAHGWHGSFWRNVSPACLFSTCTSLSEPLFHSNTQQPSAYSRRDVAHALTSVWFQSLGASSLCACKQEAAPSSSITRLLFCAVILLLLLFFILWLLICCGTSHLVLSTPHMRPLLNVLSQLVLFCLFCPCCLPLPLPQLARSKK